MNAVVRWEYLPGSILFLVWQQSRREDADTGSFEFGREISSLLGTAADNMFIIKVSYFLGL